MEKKKKGQLYAGAAKAEIRFPKEGFPTWKEKFTGVHDIPHVRVICAECGEESFLLADFELVSVNDDIVRFQKLAEEKTGIPESRIWICATHTLTTPHLFQPKDSASEEEKKNYGILHATVQEAFLDAVEKAAGNRRPARVGYGEGTCSVNVNRVIESKEGWWLGSNEEGPSSKTLPVLRFDDEEGKAIAILFCYDLQCAVMENSVTGAGEKLISADLAGVSAAFVETEFPGATAIYGLGAGGDQAPTVKAVRTVRGREGVLSQVDIHEKGYLLLELLGERIGQEAVAVAERIRANELKGSMKAERRKFVYEGQDIPDMHSLKPVHKYEYRPTGAAETEVSIVKLGEFALVGVNPELGTRTGARIREGSPFAGTALMTFVNGGMKYMVEEDYYEKLAFQAMNSKFRKGTAERFGEDIRNLLQEMYKTDEVE